MFILVKLVKKHNQIGETHNFAIFPDEKSGHESLLGTLRITYGDSSIHNMIYSYAPPKDHNPTKKYEKMIRERTGIADSSHLSNCVATSSIFLICFRVLNIAILMQHHSMEKHAYF